MMVYGETSTFDTGAGSDQHHGPPARRMSASADGPLGYGRRREISESSDRAKPEPEAAALVLGNFQGVVVIDMGFVMVGEGKTKKLRIEAPEGARRAVTTVGVDPRHPLAGGIEVNFDGELSLPRGEFHEAQVTWRPEAAGKFRGNLAFRVDGRFPAQVSVVGEAIDTSGAGAGNGKGRKGEAREGRRRTRGPASSIGGGVGRSSSGGSRGSSVGRRRSLSREASRGGEAYTSQMYGKENRLTLSSNGLPSVSAMALGSSSVSALAQGTTNKRQQMLKYSASRRLSLKLPPKGAKSDVSVDGDTRSGPGGESKSALMRKALHDKGWAEKQAAGFTKWLNFTLVGAEQLRHGGGDEDDDEEFVGEAGGVSSSPLKAMVAMRKAARQRMKSMCLFRSAEMMEVTCAVSEKVNDGTISLRRDRVLHADVGLSSALIDLVLCYEPRWLLLGLETVFGEIVPLPPHASLRSGRVDRALRSFVTERLVKCPQIKALHGFKGRVASGLSEMEYNEDVGRHALVNFLDLVLFLDRAKTENVLHPCPCLFRKTAEVKSSVEMLKVFCQFLHGEGNFVRHLKKMGYVVVHEQSFVDEFDFRVENLAVDLRDGVRLTRLVEVVTGEWGLAVGLRVPAVSRLQKMFNTKRAMLRLEQDGVVAPSAAAAVTASDVVSGNRDATLRLLWAIIARYSFCALLDRDALASEVEGVVDAARKWRKAGFSPARPSRFSAMPCTAAAAAAAASGST